VEPNDAVLRLLRDRRKQESVPGARTDGARLVLVVEGGSSRGATDALSGRPVDLRPSISDQASLQAALRASTAMPLLAGEPVPIGGRLFVDAGVSEAVPVRTALRDGATHIVALRTRRTDESATPPSRGERMVLSRRAPGASEPWLGRVALRAEEERLLATHPAVMQIRPPLGSVRIGRTERRPGPLRTAVGTGLAAATRALEPL
jgi:predicted acylesterase/phospholipase RssA